MAKTIEAILEEIQTELKKAETENHVLDIWFTDETMNFLLSNTKPTVEGRHLVLTSDFCKTRFKLGTAREDFVLGPNGNWVILEVEYGGEKIYEKKNVSVKKYCHTI